MTSISRRDILRKVGLAGSLISIPAVAGVVVSSRAEARVCAAPADDAELIRLGEEFDRLYAEWLPLRDEHRRCADLRDRAWKTGGFKFSADAYNRCCEWSGVIAADAAEEPVLAQLDALAESILVLSASTFQGIAIKLRVVWFSAFPNHDPAEDEDEMDWDARCLMLVRREVQALAGGVAS